MASYTLFQVDAFTGKKFTGNPAGVVLNADGLTDGQMQLIARELNNSETAFVLSPTAEDHEVWLRYFTPTTEVPLCGHATIAAHYIRAMALNLPSGTLFHKTGAGILPVKIDRQKDDVRVTMTQGAISFEPPMAPDQVSPILSALGIQAGDLDRRCPVQVASAGHSKVMIGIQSRKRLDSLTLDFNSLKEISRRIGCNGYFVFTFDSPDPGILTCARMFAPAIGINEDPVTGNGNGPLGAYLVHHRLVDHDIECFCFKGRQGEAMGRPGIASVEVDIKNGRPVRTRVGGQAVKVFETVISI